MLNQGLKVKVTRRPIAVASIARDDPSPLPGMHRVAGPTVHASALWAASTMRGKFGSEFET